MDILFCFFVHLHRSVTCLCTLAVTEGCLRAVVPNWWVGSRTRFQWVARLWLGNKKVQKNDHALILKGSECMLLTLLNSRWRRYPVMLMDSRHFIDRRKARVCFHMRVTMAKRRYDIDYIKYGFFYIEDKRGERPQCSFWFGIKMQPLEC